MNSGDIDIGRMHVSVLGFSTGCLLTGSIDRRFAKATYEPIKAALRLSARPDLVGMIYPVLAPPLVYAGIARCAARP
jgi:hypothetical protein